MLLNACLVLFVTFSVGINTAESSTLPSYIHVCKRKDPNVEKCVLKTVEEIKPYLKNGIPELGIPPAEPFEIPLIGDPSKGVAVGRNVKVYGASDFQVEKLKIDFSNEARPTIHLTVNLPHLLFEGEYEVNTKILVLPIQGKGPLKFDAFNTKADAVLFGQVYKKGNKNYLRFVKMDMTLDMEDYSIHLGNLFNGDKQLEEATNRVLNENKRNFMEAVSPTATKHVIEFVLEFANSVVKNRSYDELFPN